ncbi:DUF4314 domain-containing protein [Macrococcoides caseolyticum]|uniref:DUF4314 domain-containing protein n=1 Tax=Macrococcoides caseolyticum TaxID=69966 RepID=UPI00214E8EBB|nr:DUF4314 domain-containing protein [Macrococcus caseolyticus]
MMNMNRKRIEELKSEYPAGTFIVLNEMKGEPQMFSGLRGTVSKVDDLGQIHVNWENNSTLALNVDEDDFDVIGGVY